MTATTVFAIAMRMLAASAMMTVMSDSQSSPLERHPTTTHSRPDRHGQSARISTGSVEGDGLRIAASDDGIVRSPSPEGGLMGTLDSDPTVADPARAYISAV